MKDLNEIVKEYTFSAVEAESIFRSALETATVMGLGADGYRQACELAIAGGGSDAYLRMEEQANKHAWTVEQQADLVEKLAPLVDVFTYEGLVARISPLLRGLDVTPISGLDSRRPCLVGNHKHWFLRWQTRKWVCAPSPMVGGEPGGQCEVTMAIVEDQETGQVQEVYPREVRFLDSRV